MAVKKHKFITKMNILAMSMKLLKVKLLKLITSMMLPMMKIKHTKAMSRANNLNQLVVKQMWLVRRKIRLMVTCIYNLIKCRRSGKTFTSTCFFVS